MALERIQKIIARAGIASRREAERLIEEGHVTVNGALVTRLGTQIDPERDAVAVDGVRVRSRERTPLTIVVHKPPSVVSTTRDPEERRTVLDLVPDLGRRLFPVGRLDWDASGLLILTDDGDLANRLMHPRFEVPRTYEVKVKGIPDEAAIEALKTADGHERPVKARLLKSGDANAWIELTIRTGRHHEVKEMCAAAGHPVVKLVRTRYGPVSLGTLQEGRWRKLTLEEVQALSEIGKERVGESGVKRSGPKKPRPTTARFTRAGGRPSGRETSRTVRPQGKPPGRMGGAGRGTRPAGREGGRPKGKRP